MKLSNLQRIIIIAGVVTLALAVNDSRSAAELYPRLLAIVVAGIALVFAFAPRVQPGRGITLNLTQRIIVGLGTVGVVAVFIFPPTYSITVPQTSQTLKERYGDQLSSADRKKRDFSAFDITGATNQSFADKYLDSLLATLTNDTLYQLAGIEPPQDMSEEELSRTRHYYDSVDRANSRIIWRKDEIDRRLKHNVPNVPNKSHIKYIPDYEKASLYAIAILFVTCGLTFATKSNRSEVA